MSKLSLKVNGKNVGPFEVSDEIMMIDFLHEYLNLTGTKFGCGEGICHACVIIVDNEDGTSQTMRTCVNSANSFNNKSIRTIEGLAQRNSKNQITKLSPVQQSFIEHYSFQCGWCTSGFTNEATVLFEELEKKPIATKDVEARVEKALGQHVCRCSGYIKYHKATRDLIKSTKGLTFKA